MPNGSADNYRPECSSGRTPWSVCCCEGDSRVSSLPANLNTDRLNGGHMMRKTKREPDAVNLLKGFEERRFLQRPEFRRRSRGA